MQSEQDAPMADEADDLASVAVEELNGLGIRRSRWGWLVHTEG